MRSSVSGKRTEALEKTVYIGLMTFTFILPLITIITYFADEWNCMIWQWATVLASGLFSFICSVVHKIIFGKNIRLRAVDCLLIILMILGIISTIFSKNVFNSFFGREYREEGLIILISYFAMFWAATLIENQVYKRNIILMFFVRGTVEAIIAILQVFNVIPARAMGMFVTYQGISPGFAPHPNYYGTIACMLCALATGFFLFSKTKKQNTVFIILSSLFFAAVICSYARNAFLGVICGIVFCIVMELIRCGKKNLKNELIEFFKRLCVLFVCFATVFTVFYNTTDLIKNRIEMTKNDLSAVLTVPGGNWGIMRLRAEEAVNKEDTDKGISDDAGSGRIYIWKRGLKALKYYWLTGVGIDNYQIATHHPALGEFENRKYDLPKAHNEYLHVAVTEGVFAALVNLAFLFAVFIILIKKWISADRSNSLFYLNFGFSIAFISYLAQAFFNSSIIDVAPFFWIICGLICTRSYETTTSPAKKRKQ